MDRTDLPSTTQTLIADALRALEAEANLPPRTRAAVLRSLGPGGAPQSGARRLPALAFADRVRARVARQAAERVLPLWQTALDETVARYGRDEAFEREERLRERVYREQRRSGPIEQISVYDVPRSAIAGHIMAMTDLAWRRAVADEAHFLAEAGEWWQVYPGGDAGAVREIAITWAAQESLDAITGRSSRRDDPPDAGADLFSMIAAGPSEHAALAYADPQANEEQSVAPDKLRAFWRWWLTEAIPRAWHAERWNAKG